MPKRTHTIYCTSTTVWRTNYWIKETRTRTCWRLWYREVLRYVRRYLQLYTDLFIFPITVSRWLTRNSNIGFCEIVIWVERVILLVFIKCNCHFCIYEIMIMVFYHSFANIHNSWNNISILLIGNFFDWWICF